MSGQHTDGLNEQVPEDNIMNVNGWSTGDSADESYKMILQMHQLMSQGNQVVETTPGHSQKLFKTVNLREKNGSSHQRHNRQHNDGKVISLGSLLGMPVKSSNGFADKNNNQTYIQR